jgi:hypothetical protein
MDGWMGGGIDKLACLSAQNPTGYYTEDPRPRKFFGEGNIYCHEWRDITQEVNPDSPQIAIVRATEIAVNDAAGTETVLWCRARVRQVTDMGKTSDADTPNRCGFTGPTPPPHPNLRGNFLIPISKP